TNCAWSLPICASTEAVNQRASGTRAIAVRRWRHQCSTPSFAEPSPTARPSGERSRPCPAIISASLRLSRSRLAPLRQAGGDGDDRQDGARREDGPAARVGALEREAAAGVPGEVAYAVAEMEEERIGPADEEQDADP